MADQIVEITQPGYWLNKSRGFLEVHSQGSEVGKVPLDDILAVIVSVPGCSISTVLIDQLCQRNIPLVICGANFLPSSFVWPAEGYGRQFQVMAAQVELSVPRRKRAWQKVVQAKIGNQAMLLEQVGENGSDLTRLARKVKSGDPENCEAQAARLYWQLLFGKSFRRDRDSPGRNAALNYTYAVVRACVARGVCSAGLHPSLSLHHKNPRNPYNLVDDLIEPFRPIADFLVWHMDEDEVAELVPETKSKLASITASLVPVGQDVSPLSLAAARTCRSYAHYCQGNSDDLLLPAFPRPLEMPALSCSSSH